MASREELDEIAWSNREWAAHFGGIHENTVLFYFAKSPFFDQTSNNASVETQAMFNPSMTYLLGDRETFEGHLRTLQGLEYMVHLGPRDFGGEKPIGEGSWVIRKQNRRKRPGQEDLVTVLASYFVVGENIYMSPSVYNIIGSRLLSATSSLNKLFAKASSLPIYTPALGHRYIPPTLKPREQALSVRTPRESKENTPMPGSQNQTEGLTRTTSNTATVPTSNTGADLATLHDAFMQFNAYGNEYMDENPLLGEPGAFVFSSSKQHLKAQQDAAAKRAQQRQAAAKSHDELRLPSRVISAAPVTPKLNTANLSPEKDKKTLDATRSAGAKLRRRKSKAPNSPADATPGPTTPAAAAAAATPGGAG